MTSIVEPNSPSDPPPAPTNEPAPTTGPALTVTDLHVSFPLPHQGFLRRRGPRQRINAVAGVSLTLAPGGALGIVGESGSGKSTLVRAIAGLQQPTSGSIRLAGHGVRRPGSVESAKDVQMVFQDPTSALNPRRTVGSVLAEVLRVHRPGLRGADLTARLAELMDDVGLPARLLDQRPTRLSGGQKQRVCIARALAVRPRLLVLDEATAALDVSAQIGILELLGRLRAEHGIGMVFVSHDLAAVRSVCDEVAVMYLGRIVERGPVADVLARPYHPYTAALLAAEPSLDTHRRPGTSGLEGEPPSPINLPLGCSFENRCSIAADECSTVRTELGGTTAHVAACLRPLRAVPA
ncbi:ABC transporter ATP-binding protein [Millisia brevis]|uniref:ABC transporter ATP-binding protein n=1 Tax=Millisia brevis TaxID=264148 RepID=UPI00083254C1|nr:oligopeptide/dipeptide ABC transporter ATP-binding protein [Millisia brevis]